MTSARLTDHKHAKISTHGLQWPAGLLWVSWIFRGSVVAEGYVFDEKQNVLVKG